MAESAWKGPARGIAGAAVLFGAWFALAPAAEGGRPSLERPAGAERCLESAEWMRARHPALLEEWRTAVVREGRREWTSSTGEVHAASLEGTCLGCHGSRREFCARCHDWAGVRENCWECHVDAR